MTNCSECATVGAVQTGMLRPPTQEGAIREGKSNGAGGPSGRCGSYINSEVGFRNGGFLERAAERA